MFSAALLYESNTYCRFHRRYRRDWCVGYYIERLVGGTRDCVLPRLASPLVYSLHNSWNTNNQHPRGSVPGCRVRWGANNTEGGRPVKANLVQLTKHPVLSCHTASMPRSAFTIQIHGTESKHRRLPGRCLAGTPGFLIVTVMQYGLCCVEFTPTITVTHIRRLPGRPGFVTVTAMTA